MHVNAYDRVTGLVFLTTEINAHDIVARGGGRYGIGDVCPDAERMTEDEWREKAGLPAAPPAPVEANKVMAGEGLPMPGETPDSIAALKAKIAELEAKLSAPTVNPVAEPDAPHEDAGGLTTRELNADLEAAGIEIDPADAPADKAAKLSDAQAAALDRDGDGKPGGSKPRTPEEEAERIEVIASLREKGIPFFAGHSTEKLKAKLAEA
ncbi:MAG: hypothetical protein IOB84_13655 [Brevundimonas sp.]|nr:hypothetical protein [Brevundimonas sp.]